MLVNQELRENPVGQNRVLKDIVRTLLPMVCIITTINGIYAQKHDIVGWSKDKKKNTRGDQRPPPFLLTDALSRRLISAEYLISQVGSQDAFIRSERSVPFQTQDERSVCP